MKNLVEASRYINSFSKPEGLNNYSWRAIKKLALYAWECYFEGRPFSHSVNYMCREFYLMIRDPQQGNFILNKRFYHDHQL